MISIRRRNAAIFAITFISLIYLFTESRYTPQLPFRSSEHRGPWYDKRIFSAGTSKPGSNATYSRTFVVGKLQTEDTNWIRERFPNDEIKLYEVDGPESVLPANKGHEAMVYLTYIIDHYENLPDVVLFFHPHQFTWHNNILNNLDTATTLERLSSPHVIRQGYFNFRCHHDPGCPSWLKVDRLAWFYDEVKKPEEKYLTTNVFQILHPGVKVPPTISQPCCAQFAVSGERIRARPLADYHRYRDWLINTDLKDEASGRIMEYSWQYIFTGLFEWCPSQAVCYCDGYGICFSGGEAGLQNWLNMLRTREKLDERIQDLLGAGKIETSEYISANKERNVVNTVLSELKADAIQRGSDPKIRAEDCGRVWHEGDGF